MSSTEVNLIWERQNKTLLHGLRCKDLAGVASDCTHLIIRVDLWANFAE